MMQLLHELILEFGPKEGLTPTSCPGWVPTLNLEHTQAGGIERATWVTKGNQVRRASGTPETTHHKILDQSVENNIVVLVQLRQTQEIFTGTRGQVAMEFQV